MFNLREYLIENLETEVFDIDILDKISRNIDLNNRLYIIYDSKINKPVDNTELSDIDYILIKIYSSLTPPPPPYPPHAWIPAYY